MKECYVYYESKNNKNNESTSEVFEVFKEYKNAHEYLLLQRNFYIKEYNLVPHNIDGLGDKSWCRLIKDDNNYMDLIIEKKNIKDIEV